jgi:oxygen-independent coproporphyrinogen-3 oxidase
MVKFNPFLIKLFDKILEENDYFWDVNSLHSKFKYNNRFSLEEIKNYWVEFLKHNGSKIGKTIFIDFYIHIPFCFSKCEYCIFFRSTIPPVNIIDNYINLLIYMFKYFSPVFRGYKFRHLYIGGGTPNVLPEYQLRKLLINLFDNFDFQPNGQKTCEINPRIIKYNYFKILREFGFNRISFGVQTLNPKALEINNRIYQTEEKIREAFSIARELKFIDINADLIAGLAGDTENDFIKSFIKLSKLEPNNIVVYGLMLPKNSNYLKLLKMSQYFYYMKFYPNFITKILSKLSVISTKLNYEPDSLEISRWHWGFRNIKYKNINIKGNYKGEFSGCIFGVGHDARSRIHNTVEYRQIFNLDSESLLPLLIEGRKSNEREEMIKYIINSFSISTKLDKRQFEKFFGKNMNKIFSDAINFLKSLKVIEETNKKLILRVDYPPYKYVYASFFLRNNV